MEILPLRAMASFAPRKNATESSRYSSRQAGAIARQERAYLVAPYPGTSVLPLLQANSRRSASAENQGMRGMFTLMNQGRLGVGLEAGRQRQAPSAPAHRASQPEQQTVSKGWRRQASASRAFPCPPLTVPLPR